MMSWTVEFEREIVIDDGEVLQWLLPPTLINGSERQTAWYRIFDANGAVREKDSVEVLVYKNDGP